MILNIELLNWKKHEKLKLEFNKGSNILIGNMGSGKTSILQANPASGRVSTSDICCQSKMKIDGCLTYNATSKTQSFAPTYK